MQCHLPFTISITIDWQSRRQHRVSQHYMAIITTCVGESVGGPVGIRVSGVSGVVGRLCLCFPSNTAWRCSTSQTLRFETDVFAQIGTAKMSSCAKTFNYNFNTSIQMVFAIPWMLSLDVYFSKVFAVHKKKMFMVNWNVFNRQEKNIFIAINKKRIVSRSPAWNVHTLQAFFTLPSRKYNRDVINFAMLETGNMFN